MRSRAARHCSARRTTAEPRLAGTQHAAAPYPQVGPGRGEAANLRSVLFRLQQLRRRTFTRPTEGSRCARAVARDRGTCSFSVGAAAMAALLCSCDGGRFIRSSCAARAIEGCELSDVHVRSAVTVSGIGRMYTARSTPPHRADVSPIPTECDPLAGGALPHVRLARARGA
jgi:hypothetical protein